MKVILAYVTLTILSIQLCVGLDDCYQLYELTDDEETILGEQIVINQSTMSLIYGDEAFDIVSLDQMQFGDKESVIRFFHCGEMFEHYDKRGIFSIYTIALDSGSDLHIVTSADSNIIYVIQDGEVMTAIVCATDCIAPFYHNPFVETGEVEVQVFNNAANITVVNPTFETVTEQVLVRDSYITLKNISAQFETVTDQVVESYTNICPDYQAVYIEVEEVRLKKEAYSYLTIIPATLEMVTEGILVSQAYTRYRLQTLDATEDVVVVESPAYTEIDWNQYPDCQSEYPYDCLAVFKINHDIEYLNLGSIDSWGCESGDTPLTTLIKEEVPASYALRPYLRLVAPSTTQSTDVPAELITRTYTDIENRASIPDECIEVAYTTITYQRLVNPATTESTTLPAIYQTRSYQRLISDGSATYPLDEVMCENNYARQFITQDFEEKLDSFYCDGLSLKQQMDVASCLMDVEYIDDQVAFGSGEFWDAMFQFLSDWDRAYIGPLTDFLIRYFEKP